MKTDPISEYQLEKHGFISVGLCGGIFIHKHKPQLKIESDGYYFYPIINNEDCPTELRYVHQLLKFIHQ